MELWFGRRKMNKEKFKKGDQGERKYYICFSMHLDKYFYIFIFLLLFCIYKASHISLFENKEDKTFWIGRKIVGEEYTIQEGFREDGLVVWRKTELRRELYYLFKGGGIII